MTFAIGRVEGGTGAGRKRPLKQRPMWTCNCVELLPGKLLVYDARGAVIADASSYLPAHLSNHEFRTYRVRTDYSCPDCGARRP